MSSSSSSSSFVFPATYLGFTIFGEIFAYVTGGFVLFCFGVWGFFFGGGGFFLGGGLFCCCCCFVVVGFFVCFLFLVCLFLYSNY